MAEEENLYTLFDAARREKQEGNKERAKVLYRRVIVEYPNEFEAGVAKSELAELEGRKPSSNTEPKEGEKVNDVNQMYPDFNRKQLAWMGLLLGAVLIVVLNWEYSYRSVVEDTARELFSYRNYETGVWIINVVLVVVTWFLRVALGIIFAFVVGVVINVFAFLFKKV